MKYYTTRMKTSPEDYVNGITPTNKFKGDIQKLLLNPNAVRVYLSVFVLAIFRYGDRFQKERK